MLKIKEAIIVEGRYDKNSLSQVVDGLILETSGFGVFKDGEKLELIRRLAQRQGIIVLTDSAGKEGKLGVEGMNPEVLRQALLRAGATVVDGDGPAPARGDLTPADLFALGLTGRPDSAARREKLLHRLGLPQHMNSKALLAMLNALHTPDEVAQMVEELEQSKE